MLLHDGVTYTAHQCIFVFKLKINCNHHHLVHRVKTQALHSAKLRTASTVEKPKCPV